MTARCRKSLVVEVSRQGSRRTSHVAVEADGARDPLGKEEALAEYVTEA